LSENDVILFYRKRFCDLELEVRVGLGLRFIGLKLGLRLGLELTEIRLNTFSVEHLFGQV